MAFSIQRVTSDGTLSTIDLTISYIDRVDISLLVDDIPIDYTGGVTTYTWEWVTDTQLKITPTVADTLVVTVKRLSDNTNMFHNFNAGAVFKDESVDENFLQLLYLTQEAKEGSGATDLYTDLNMHGYIIHNHGPALLDGDLITYGQVLNDSAGALYNRVAAESARDISVASESTAVTKAAEALLSEQAAFSSAGAAAISASDADADRILAEAAAVSAAASYDSFDDRYLGALPADPTVDNDGDPLLEGAVYWNTITKALYFYDGAMWGAINLVVDNYLNKTLNLSDILDAVSARSNLGLGTSATKDVGTAAGDVAAGDDARILGALPAANVKQVTGTSTTDVMSQKAVSDVLEDQIGFTIIYPNGGSKESPANVSVNTRYVEDSPFPGNHIVCEAEIRLSGIWGRAGSSFYGGSSGTGVNAFEYNGGIVVQTGNHSLTVGSAIVGNPFGIPAAVSTPLPCRVKVWKVKGAIL